MKTRLIVIILLLISFNCGLLTANTPISDFGWKAGVAKAVITPTENIWLAGYGSRTKPAEGKLHDLWAKALYLEDSTGYSVLLVTTDLLGFPKGLSDRIRNRISFALNLDFSQIILSSSHTHSGPVLPEALNNIYPLDEEQKLKIEKYAVWLEDQIVTLSKQSRDSLRPAKLYVGNGAVRFQVNRRNNSEADIHKLNELKGPNDYSVPVLKVEHEDGNPAVILFGYACHPTVLNGYQWSGDYPGYAQLKIEDIYDGATAMFFQGAGADQNPLPRRTIPLAKQYGLELAASVERVLSEEMVCLSPTIKTVYNEIELPLDLPLSIDELKKVSEENTGYIKNWACETMDKIQNGDYLPKSYPFPVQIWQLDTQLIAILGGEILTNYSIRLKEILGHDTFIMGYSNDLMAYIPSEKVLEEGGYEGETSQIVYGFHSKWKSGIEQAIIDAFIKMGHSQDLIQLNDSVSGASK